MIKLSVRLGDGRLKETWMFFLRMIVLALPLYFGILFVDLYSFQAITAYNSFQVMEGMGLHPSIEGPMMSVGDFNFFISKDSTGWKSMVFLGAMVLAVPAVAWKRRAIGLAIGIPLIYLGNLARIVGIVLAEQAWGYDAAIVTHDWLWRSGLVAIVLGIWILWMRWAKWK